MVTIKDIAQQLNMSTSTVSRALNDHPAIKPETKKRVLECMNQQNYVPNRNARNLVNRQNHTIGFMIPDISDSFFSHSAFGVEEVLYRSGHDIAYSSTERKPERIRDFLIHAREYRYSGVFLTPDKWDDALIDLVHNIGIPVVSLRRKTPHTDPEIPYVDSDHYGGCREATEYLITQGHTSIGLIVMNTIIERERQQGYEDTIHRNGLKPYVVYNEFSPRRNEVGYSSAKALLEQNPEITAILATDDLQAIGAMEYMSHVGRSVPDDISIIGCDDRPEARLFSIQLSTVQQNLHELGRQAAAMLLRMIAEPTYQPTSITLQSKFVLRRTTTHK